MNYFELKIPPVRDQRMTVSDSFSGNGCEMMDCAKSGCMLRYNRRFRQSGTCQMSISILMAATLENAVLIMHGPIGCGATLHTAGVGAAKGKLNRGKAAQPLVWLSTNLKESDVVNGGEEKLIETIRYADREFRPEIIFVISTCAPNIIGDDVESIVVRAQEESSAIITAIHCPGFRSRVISSAYDAFYHAILRHFPFEPEPFRDFTPLDPGDPAYEAERERYRHKKNHTVNLWRLESVGAADEREITRLLNAIGLSVRIVAEYASRDEIRFVSQAGLNVSMCNVHDEYVMKYLQEKFGTPYIVAGIPIGFRGTRAWLLAIARHFGLEKEMEKLADYEEKQVREAIEPLLPAIRGKRVLMCGGIVRVGEDAVLLQELGMDVIGVRAYHYDDTVLPLYERITEELPKTLQYSVSTERFELANQIRRIKPDIMVSHVGVQGDIAKFGVPSVQSFDTEKGFLAYNGIFTRVRSIAFGLENTSYQKRLSEHIELPYKDSWYEKDPFYYVGEESAG
ncbi:MAG: nitrogenase iron-molybdenum protein subunit alpha [Clostridiales Family XIII bacterium]|jgi:nitrogenase molybdenum-iron protein alpha chain|nr:nitrogenase iron-molybdenum protein subunit alpha [Clostridiales Family XIII bacterium]